MLIVDNPQLPPGSDFLTGAGSGPWIDTLHDIADLPPNGRVYMAHSTVEDMAALFGFAAPAAVERIVNDRAEWKTRALASEERVLELERAITALRNAGYQEATP